MFTNLYLNMRIISFFSTTYGMIYFHFHFHFVSEKAVYISICMVAHRSSIFNFNADFSSFYKVISGVSDDYIKGTERGGRTNLWMSLEKAYIWGTLPISSIVECFHMVTNHMGSMPTSYLSSLYAPKTTLNNLPERSHRLCWEGTKKWPTIWAKPSLGPCARIQVESEGTVLPNYCLPKCVLRAIGSPLHSLLFNSCKTNFMGSSLTVLWWKFYFIFSFCLAQCPCVTATTFFWTVIYSCLNPVGVIKLHWGMVHATKSFGID